MGISANNVYYCFGYVLFVCCCQSLQQPTITCTCFPKVPAPSAESLELMNFITGFELSFTAALVSVFARVVTIRKKNYTWKSSPKVRGTILAICILVSAVALKLLISILV